MKRFAPLVFCSLLLLFLIVFGFGRYSPTGSLGLGHLHLIERVEGKLSQVDNAAPLVRHALLNETVVSEEGLPTYPEALKEWDGQRVQMVGYMSAYDDLDMMAHFMLMKASVGCRFCAPPDMREAVFVRQREEQAGFVVGLIGVEGVLRLNLPGREPDEMHKTFHFVIDDARVQSLEKK